MVDPDPEAADGARGARVVRRRRRWPWLLGAAVLLLALAAAWLARLLEPERLSALLLREAAQRTGLALAVAEPADVSFWPDLHIELSGLQASTGRDGAPMLTVAAVDLVLPWSALLRREARIQALRLREPVLDRAQLAHWLEARPASTGAAWELPELSASLVVIDGSVVAPDSPASWQLRGLMLETSPLLPGRRFEAEGSAQLQMGEDNWSGRFEFATVPESGGGALLLDPLHLVVRDADGALLADAVGHLRAGPRDALSVALTVELGTMPAALAGPLGTTDAAAPASVALAYQGTTAWAGELRVEARHAGTVAEFRGVPDELLEWWAGDPRTPLPPGEGRASLPTIELEGARLEGIELQLRGSAAPDAAAPKDAAAAPTDDRTPP